MFWLETVAAVGVMLAGLGLLLRRSWSWIRSSFVSQQIAWRGGIGPLLPAGLPWARYKFVKVAKLHKKVNHFRRNEVERQIAIVAQLVRGFIVCRSAFKAFDATFVWGVM